MFQAGHRQMTSPRKLNFHKGQKCLHQIGQGSLLSVLLSKEPCINYHLFAIQKGIVGLAGEPKSVKKRMRSGLLIECTTQRHSICLLQSTVFCNVPVKVTAHSSLNSSKGVIRCRDLEGVSEEEICQILSSQDVTSVRWIKVRRNNKLLPTNTFVLTFNVSTFPKFIKAGYLNIPVKQFNPNPLCRIKFQRTEYLSWKTDMRSLWSV